ncbi:hypothetical protein GQR58_015435 [Nymphon striatum]|nr:hypothetical protein GQR58_015435 [Nymphon striatum]
MFSDKIRFQQIQQNSYDATENKPRSEFYLDLLDVFSDPNNNPSQPQRNLNEEPITVGNPTIIRPKVAPRSSASTSIKKPKPAARLSIHSTSKKPRASLKKKPPPRPAPPKFAKPTISQRLPKVPPSYSKVLEEDIRACIDAYSTTTRDRSSSSLSRNAPVSQTPKSTRSSSNPEYFDLVQLNTSDETNKEPSSMNINGVNVTTKNVKQAGSVASFLNKNPKLAKHVVPSKYQSAVKVSGKMYDFRETHKDKLKHSNVKQEQKCKTPHDLLGSIESEENFAGFESSFTSYTAEQNTVVKPSYHSSELSQTSNVELKKTKSKAPVKPLKPAPLKPVELNAIDPINNNSIEKANITENKPLSPSIPEPEHPPPVLLDPSESPPCELVNLSNPLRAGMLTNLGASNFILGQLNDYSFEPQGIALMNYTARNPDEISFQISLCYLRKTKIDSMENMAEMKGIFPSFVLMSCFLYLPKEEARSRAVSEEHHMGISTVSVDIINKLENKLSSMSVTETAEISETNICSKESSLNSEMIAVALYDYDGDSGAGDISFQDGFCWCLDHASQTSNSNSNSLFQQQVQVTTL